MAWKKVGEGKGWGVGNCRWWSSLGELNLETSEKDLTKQWMASTMAEEHTKHQVQSPKFISSHFSKESLIMGGGRRQPWQQNKNHTPKKPNLAAAVFQAEVCICPCDQVSPLISCHWFETHFNLQKSNGSPKCELLCIYSHRVNFLSITS